MLSSKSLLKNLQLKRDSCTRKTQRTLRNIRKLYDLEYIYGIDESDSTFATAITVVSVWFMMLQCFAKYSVSRVLQSSPIIDPSKEVSRSQTLRAKLELMKYSRQNLIPYGACVCGYAAKKKKKLNRQDLR